LRSAPVTESPMETGGAGSRFGVYLDLRAYLRIKWEI